MVDVGIARTLAELNRCSEIREVEPVNIAAIAAARRMICLEDQYLASPSWSSSCPATPRAILKSRRWTVRDNDSSNYSGPQTITNV